MFSGYLQAGIYKGLDGHLRLAGWRWMFTFCGIISLPASIWGLYAIRDSPYKIGARWLPEASKQLYIDQIKKLDYRAAAPLSWGKIRRTLTHWPKYIISLMLKWDSPSWIRGLKVLTELVASTALSLNPSTTSSFGWSHWIDLMRIGSTSFRHQISNWTRYHFGLRLSIRWTRKETLASQVMIVPAVSISQQCPSEQDWRMTKIDMQLRGHGNSRVRC